jgi:hypothetical protein
MKKLLSQLNRLVNRPHKGSIVPAFYRSRRLTPAPALVSDKGVPMAAGQKTTNSSVTVRANWRIIFRFEGGTVFDVELIDYH